MKKFLALVALLISLPVFGLTPAETKAHSASYQIGQATLSGGGRCSATAIAPHALLTASHCEEPTDALYIRGIADNPVEIVGKIRDEQDHTIYLLKGVTFADYVEVAPDKFEQGENVFTFGNPGKWQDIYQRGYVVGILVDNSMEAALGGGDPDELLFDLQVFPGQSGAGVFSPEGKLIAVISSDRIQVKDEEGIAFGSAFRLNFKSEDIARALSFSAETPKAAK